MAEIQQAISFSMLKTKKKTKKLTNLIGTAIEVYDYEIGTINIYLKGVEISVSTIF